MSNLYIIEEITMYVAIDELYIALTFESHHWNKNNPMEVPLYFCCMLD